MRAERDEISAELPRPLAGTVSRVEEGRQGRFLAKAEDGVCQACYVRVRPQVFQEIKLATRVHACASCRRFLYYEPVIEKLQADAAAGGEERPELGAVNDSTV